MKIKMKIFAIIAGVTCMHLLLISVIGISGGCRNPQALQQRVFIPAQKEVLEIEDLSSPEETPLIQEMETGEIEISPSGTVDSRTTLEMEVKPESYKVVKGDSFWKIAREYGVSMHELAAFNNMTTKTPLKIGQSLMIPPGGKLLDKTEIKPVKYSRKKTASKIKPSPEKLKIPENGMKHTVKKGDSLWKIAVKYNLKTSTLAKANNISLSSPLKIGQTLVIPGAKGMPAPAEEKTAENKTDFSVPPETQKATNETEPADADDILKLLDDTGEQDTDTLLDDLAPETPQNEQNVDSILKDTEIRSGTGTNETVEVINDTTLDEFAKNYGVKPENIIKLNPGLPSNKKLTSGMIIVLP